jgi:hypothetical protein
MSCFVAQAIGICCRDGAGAFALLCVTTFRTFVHEFSPFQLILTGDCDATGSLSAIPGELAPIVWMKLKADYRQFTKRLKAHEAAEDALLRRAFNEDPGTAF